MSVLAQEYKNHRQVSNPKPETLNPKRFVSCLAEAHTYGGAVEPDDASNISVRDLTLRVHAPKLYILWPQSTYIGTTLRPKCILFGYMDPKEEGRVGLRAQGTQRAHN